VTSVGNANSIINMFNSGNGDIKSLKVLFSKILTFISLTVNDCNFYCSVRIQTVGDDH
jgi:hypothetical protein